MRAAFAALALIAAPAWAQADPLAGMGASVSAVLDVAKAPRVLLVESANGVTNLRTLAVGEEYRDGWRLTGIARDQLVMRKGGEERRVRISERVARAAPAETVTLGAIAPLTNSDDATSLKRPAWEEAVAKGDVRGAFDLNAPTEQATAAIRAAGVNAGLDTGRLAAIDRFTRMQAEEGAQPVRIRGANGGLGVLMIPAGSSQGWLLRDNGEVGFVEDLDRDGELLLRGF